MAKKEKKEPRRSMQLGATALSVVESVEAVPIVKGFSASVNGLEIDGRPSFAAAEAAGRSLLVIERGAQFALGDFVIYVESAFGEKASQIIDFQSGWSEKTTAVYRWLASRIAKADRRMDRLGVAHHMLVAALIPSRQRHWLKEASSDEDVKPWTVAKLRASLREGEDAPVTSWWVLVACTDEEDQLRFQEEMERTQRSTKAIMKHGKAAAAIPEQPPLLTDGGAGGQDEGQGRAEQ